MLELRPTVARRPGVSLQHQPASTIRVHTKYSKQKLVDFSLSVKDILAEDR
jgi:hypothetical protein